MRRLCQKFSFYYLGYTALVTVLMFPLMNHDRLTGPDPLSLNFIFSLAPFLFIAVLGGLWTHELAEQKSSAYTFLDTLPIGVEEVVGAKFLLVLLSVLGFVGFHWLALALISTNPDYLVPSRNYLIVHSNICLILAGLIYAGIYRYGFGKFGKFVFAAYLLSIFYPIPLTTLILPRINISRRDLILTTAHFSPVVSTLIGLSIFYGLFRLSVHFKIKYRRQES